MAVTSEVTFFKYSNDYNIEQLRAVIEYANSGNAESVYFLVEAIDDIWVPKFLRLLDHEGPVYLSISDSDDSVIWVTALYNYYEKYVDVQGKKDTALILVVDPAGEEFIEMGGYWYKKGLQLEDYALYDCVGTGRVVGE